MQEIFFGAGKKSEIGFLLGKENLRVYSIEEICYFIKKWPGKADPVFMSREFLDFLETLGVDTKVFGEMISNHCMLWEICREILKLSNASTDEQEIDMVLEEIRENEQLLPSDRAIKIALYEKEKHHYKEAYRLFLSALLCCKNDENKAKSIIYQNMGEIAARFFCYEKALEWFEKSLKQQESEKSLRGYLICKKFLMSEEEYRSMVQNDRKMYEAYIQLEKEFDICKKETAEEIKRDYTVDIFKLRKEFEEMLQ